VAETLKIGARSSPLSQTQTGLVIQALTAARPGLEAELIPIKTAGDMILDAPLSRIGLQGVFVKEIEEALLAGEIDLAVHSAKDLPSRLPHGLVLGAVMARADYRDVLISDRPGGLLALPRGARVGTSGLRRQAQILARRPDIRIVPVRGNVGTRLGKVGSEVEAALLAAAGLDRLGLHPPSAERLDPADMLPAVGQGVLALEIRRDDARMAGLISSLHHRPTGLALAAERGFLEKLGGGCQLPAAALARPAEGGLLLEALIAEPSGAKVLRGRKTAPAGDQDAAADLGRALADELLGQGGADILKALEPQAI
jgi:hydroxymethylbilane synthase